MNNTLEFDSSNSDPYSICNVSSWASLIQLMLDLIHSGSRELSVLGRSHGVDLRQAYGKVR